MTGKTLYATIELERVGVETKVKIVPHNKDGTLLTISEEDEDKFIRELQHVLYRYFIPL